MSNRGAGTRIDVVRPALAGGADLEWLREHAEGG
jgi:hypothetical protein